VGNNGYRKEQVLVCHRETGMNMIWKKCEAKKMKKKGKKH